MGYMGSGLGYGMGYGFDPTYILVIIGIILSMWASANVKHAFSKYAKVKAASGLTATAAAQMILQKNNINNVQIQGISGDLTDCYVPSQKVLNLSDATRNSDSIAAIGVAAHECGHAIQDSVNYMPLVLSRTINPICAIASKVAFPMIFIGLLISISPFIKIGIILYMVAIAFQIVTLPVEFDASRRAIATLRENSMMSEEELNGVKAVLTAAALTYIAAAASSLLQLLRLIMISRSRDRD